jgi:type IX secretion system PorP/SprF family membrane protein
MSVVNPAYVIDESDVIEIGSLYRSQWIGLSGAPKTANLFAHIPISNSLEFSVNYMNDRIGSAINIHQNLVNIDAAYKMELSGTTKLSFGIKGELNNMNFDFSNSETIDPALEAVNKTIYNMGAGFFVYNQNYYVGLSSPNIISHNIVINNMYDYRKSPHFFLIGGYVFDIGYDFLLKPSFVIKEVQGAPLSFDLSLNTLYNDRFELGASYRSQDAYSGLLGVHATENIKIGYSYDYNTSDLGRFNTGSHEFILLYRFDAFLKIRKKYASPRFY